MSERILTLGCFIVALKSVLSIKLISKLFLTLIGYIMFLLCEELAFTLTVERLLGVISLSLRTDLRKSQPYEIYELMEFAIPFSKNDDCYDRYLVRVLDARES